jgi:hypothetical protein
MGKKEEAVTALLRFSVLACVLCMLACPSPLHAADESDARVRQIALLSSEDAIALLKALRPVTIAPSEPTAPEETAEQHAPEPTAPDPLLAKADDLTTEETLAVLIRVVQEQQAYIDAQKARETDMGRTIETHREVIGILLEQINYLKGRLSTLAEEIDADLIAAPQGASLDQSSGL